jgi:hypothetical protein
MAESQSRGGNTRARPWSDDKQMEVLSAYETERLRSFNNQLVTIRGRVDEVKDRDEYLSAIQNAHQESHRDGFKKAFQIGFGLSDKSKPIDPRTNDKNVELLTAFIRKHGSR